MTLITLARRYAHEQRSYASDLDLDLDAQQGLHIGLWVAQDFSPPHS